MTTYSAVRTTGIYCRPGCAATPRAENVQTFELAAAAEAAGYRACLRCRPYRVAGAVGDAAPELVCRAVQVIIGGALDDGSEARLAARLGVSSRHLRRLFLDHVGVTPDQLARSRRAHFARRLLDDTDLSVSDVAFASGFGSIRQFNRAMVEIFRAPPRDLRRRRRRADRLVVDGGLSLRMPFEVPYDWDGVLSFLERRSIPGVETVVEGTYRRTIVLDGAPGVLEIGPGEGDYLLLRAHLPFWEGLIHVVERASRLVGIDSSVSEAAATLRSDPIVGPLVNARPGLRAPGVWGPFETGIHAIVSGDVGPEQASEQLSALVTAHGESIPGLGSGLTHAFPSPEVIASLATRDLTIPPKTAATMRSFAEAVVSGALRLDGSATMDQLREVAARVRGLNDTAVQHLALRLGERDALPQDDPDFSIALRRLAPGFGDSVTDEWRPWRSLAAVHLMVEGHAYACTSA